MSPAVTVLIPVYRPQYDYLRDALRSILKQSFTDFEVLLVEAPCYGESADVCRRVAEDRRDPRVRHLIYPGKPGLVDQLNFGLANARGDLVARMDADDWSHPDRLQAQVDFLNAHPDIAAVGTQIDVIDCHSYPLGHRCYPTEPEAIAACLPRCNPMAHPSVMFRRHAVLEVGGYRYRRHPANEDYELWCRLVARGHRLANLPRPLVRYRIHPHSMKSEKLRGIVRGTRLVKRHYFSGKMTWRDRARYWAEGLLPALPTPLVLHLFQRLTYRRD